MPSVSAVSGLTLRLVRDDGAVVYVNGTEVWRSNMPTGSISNATLASSAVSAADQITYFPTNAISSFLASGTNILAGVPPRDHSTSSG